MTEDLRTNTNEVIVCLVVIVVVICGTVLSTCSSRHDAALQDARHQLKTAIASRDSARAREAWLRDSAAKQDDARDSAWLAYITDVRTEGAAQLQSRAHVSALRARDEVSEKLGAAFLPVASDSGSDKPPCQILTTCSDEIARQVGDSLVRARLDSVRLRGVVAAAACTTRVAEVRATCESSCVEHLRTQPSSSGFASRLLTLLGVTAIGGLLGFILGIGA